jgi:hypothetical protein
MAFFVYEKAVLSHVAKIGFFGWTIYNIAVLGGENLDECKSDYKIILFQMILELVLGCIFTLYICLKTFIVYAYKNKLIRFSDTLITNEEYEKYKSEYYSHFEK